MRKLIKLLWWRFFPPDVSIIVALQENRRLTVCKTRQDWLRNWGILFRTMTWEETYADAGLSPRAVYLVSTRLREGQQKSPVVLTRVEDGDDSAINYVVGSGSKKLSYCEEKIRECFGYIPNTLYLYLWKPAVGILDIQITRGELPDGGKWISFRASNSDEYALNWHSHTEEAYTAIGIKAKEPKLQVSTSKFPGADVLEHSVARGSDNTYTHYATNTKLEFCSYWLVQVFNFVPDQLYYKEVTE